MLTSKPKSRTIIVSADDEALLHAIAGEYPMVSSHRLAQAVYRYGLRAVAPAPERLMEECEGTAVGGAQ